KTTVETAFYSNNTREITSVKEGYELAKNAEQRIVFDATLKHAEELELPQDAHILLGNDGATCGRTAQARRIVDLDSKEDKELFPIVREVIYDASFRPFIKTTGIVGLDEDFMVRAHIAMPEKESNNMYSWLMNFQILN